MAAEPIVTATERWVPRIIPGGGMPERGVPIEYPGHGVVELWNDVFDWAHATIDFLTREGSPATEYITSQSMPKWADAIAGTTIKAVSGFINTAYDTALDAQEWASRQFDAMSANIGAIYQYFEDRLDLVENLGNAIARLAVPSLQAQIDQLNHNRLTDFQFNSAMDRLWSVDNIFKPLQEQLGQVAQQIPIWAGGAYDRAVDYTDVAVGGLGVGVLSQLVPMTNALRAIEREIEECAKPMCETMGPKTNLGKALKAFNAAEYLALFAALAALDKDGVEGLIRSLQGAADGVFDAFGELFVDGHGTVGSVLTGIG